MANLAGDMGALTSVGEGGVSVARETVPKVPAAPIFLYRDSRLWGAAFVKPFSCSYYYWVRPLWDTVYPTDYKIVEFAIRFFPFVLGVLGMTLFAPLALLGRVIQICHYESLSEETREHPSAISVDGLTLPPLVPFKGEFQKDLYGQTPKKNTCIRDTRAVLRGNFGTSEGQSTFFGEDFFKCFGWAIYAFEYVASEKKFDKLNLEVFLDSREIGVFQVTIDEGENVSIAEDGSDDWKGTGWLKEAWKEFDKSHLFIKGGEQKSMRFYKAVSRLFLMNGYKAIQFNYPIKANHYAIFDPLRVFIRGITQHR